MRIKVRNKTYSPVIITNARIRARSYVIVNKTTNQILTLEKKGLLKTRKIK